MAPFAAKKTGHRVWPVTEFLGGFFYALFRGWRDVARQRRIVQHDRNRGGREAAGLRSEEHTSELQSQSKLVCRLLLEKKKKDDNTQSDVIDITTHNHTH